MQVSVQDEAAPQGGGGWRASFRDWGWVALASLIWLFMPILKLQLSRVIPFDALMGILLLGMILMRVIGKRPRGQRKPWSPRANPVFYLACFGLVCTGLLSGLNAGDTQLWIVEVITFLYLAVMMLSMDMFSAGRMERFIQVGSWTFAGICAVTGVVATLHLLGGPKLDWFFEYSRRGATDKFTGLMRFSNQWAGYFVTIFPLLLALAFSKLKGWQRPLVVACALLGILTVPASGSRSGLFLLAGEVVGFVGLYLMLNRSDKALNRLIYIALFGVLLIGGYFLLIDQLEDSPIVRRSFGAFELVFEQEQFSDSWRDYNWRSAMTEFAKHPFIGIGLGTFEIYYDRHEVHSTYLSFLTETGVVGLVPYLVLLGLSTLQLARSFIAHVAQGRTNLVLIALLVAIGSQLLFAIHHNNARHRHVWTILLIGLLYAEVSLTHLRQELRQARQARSNALRLRTQSRQPQAHSL